MMVKNHFKCKLFVNNKADKLYIDLRKVPNTRESKVCVINLKDNKKPYKFETSPNYSMLSKYKSRTPDNRIIDYMETIDAKAMGKEDPDKMIKLCTEKINSLTNDKFEKIKLIHDMVWNLLSYDYDNYMNDKVPSQDYVSILKTNLSVCAGFANLFQEICNVTGIDCLTVSGYARGSSGPKMWKVTDAPTETNHSWNLVNVDNYWYIIDSTWDSGHTSNGVSDNYYSTT